jgi:hypothetical protein
MNTNTQKSKSSSSKKSSKAKAAANAAAVRVYIKKGSGKKAELYPKGYLNAGEIVKKGEAKEYGTASQANQAGTAFVKSHPEMAFKVVTRMQ